MPFFLFQILEVKETEGCIYWCNYQNRWYFGLYPNNQTCKVSEIFCPINGLEGFLLLENPRSLNIMHSQSHLIKIDLLGIH